MDHALVSETDNVFKKHDFKLVKLASLAPPYVGPTTGFWLCCDGTFARGQAKISIAFLFFFIVYFTLFVRKTYPWLETPCATEVIQIFRFSLLCLFISCSHLSFYLTFLSYHLIPLAAFKDFFFPFHLSLSFPTVFLSTPCISVPPSPCLSLCDMCFHYLAQGEVFWLTADHLLINSFHLATDSQSSLFIRTSLSKPRSRHIQSFTASTWWDIWGQLDDLFTILSMCFIGDFEGEISF